MSNELSTDTRICTCPTCRFARGEITASEYAWYLKGKIEARDADLRMKLNGKFMDDSKDTKDDYNLYKNYESYLKSERMDDESELGMLLESPKRRPARVDPAWLEPRNHLLEKKDGN